MPDKEVELKPFWTNKYSVNKETGCFEWSGAIQSRGYGQLNVNGKSMLAHRVSYIETHGQIPEGLTVDHKCRNRKCINPEHLRLLTLKENILVGNGPTAFNKRKTHCIHGHEFTEANTYIYKHKPNSRNCRTCQAKRDAIRFSRKDSV